jgi:hypothetical protein
MARLRGTFVFTSAAAMFATARRTMCAAQAPRRTNFSLTPFPAIDIVKFRDALSEKAIAAFYF